MQSITVIHKDVEEKQEILNDSALNKCFVIVFIYISNVFP